MCQPKGSSAYGTCGNKVTFFSLKSSFGKWENQSFLEDQSLHSVWKNVSPPNVEVSVWMALQESIVFESILVRRGILSNKQDICSLCNSEIGDSQPCVTIMSNNMGDMVRSHAMVGL